ncbi:MAG TPA: ribosome biogenesis GTPase YlqF [Cyanobacteria bacterium UBA8156]|jgi:ribosome biogenesis GTPase A|nr:ribosome biogenesis GTPase YlqF [Cyanobacteria bacterium UBA8156]
MAPPIQWYPGHVAKAERALKEHLQRVDAVIELRDARIPLASAHPQVAQWLAGKARLLVLNRVDSISATARQEWQDWFRQQGEVVYFTNAQDGTGVANLLKAAQAVGEQITARRQARGMLPRPVRAVTLGFPNVGKSALINRLLRRRAVESANRPGVTRQLRWVRVSDTIELLDTPGILPPVLSDADAAVKLAICDDIAAAAYDAVLVAAIAVDLLQARGAHLIDRYGLAIAPGEIFVAALAQAQYHGDSEKAARKILDDFRKGKLGAIALERPQDFAVR